MQVTYKTSVANAMAWHLILVNTGEIFIPNNGEITFVRNINDDTLKIRYEFSALAPITITYTCTKPDGTTSNDPKKVSPYTSPNKMQDTLSIKL